MGTLRLVLAICVLLQHSGGTFLPVDAREAVQCFFIISGFYVQLIISEIYTKQGGKWHWNFYKSRATRIFPTYYVFSILFFLILGVDAFESWDHTAVNIATYLFINISLIGIEIGNILNFCLTVLGINVQFGAPIIDPAAWSLAPELVFYLLAPLLLCRSSLFIASLAILMTCSPVVLTGLKVSNPTAFAMLFPDGPSHLVQFFPFEMSLFLAGALAYRMYAMISRKWSWPKRHAEESRRQFVKHQPVTNCVLYIASGVIWVAFMWFIWGEWGYAPNHIGRLPLPEAYWLVIIATIAALPFIFHFTRNIRWDRSLGELSYPIYLGHLLVVKVIQKYFPTLHPDISLIVLPITLVLAVLVWYCIEVPLTIWRHRRFEGLNDSQHAADSSVEVLVEMSAQRNALTSSAISS